MDKGRDIAKEGLGIKAIKLNPRHPFLWASGYYMPIYNDNRMFLANPFHRRLIANSFMEIIESEPIPFDVVAGTSTAGIPHATTLADLEKKPLVYVRDKPKDHGLRNQIEGIDAESDLQGRRVILIEDLISTWESSARAVQAIRDANGRCDYCLAIFDYGLDKAREAFSTLDPRCETRALLNYDTLLEVAIASKYTDAEQYAMLREWRKDPFNWGAKHGFPKVER